MCGGRPTQHTMLTTLSNGRTWWQQYYALGLDFLQQVPLGTSMLDNGWIDINTITVMDFCCSPVQVLIRCKALV